MTSARIKLATICRSPALRARPAAPETLRIGWREQGYSGQAAGRALLSVSLSSVGWILASMPSAHLRARNMVARTKFPASHATPAAVIQFCSDHVLRSQSATWLGATSLLYSALCSNEAAWVMASMKDLDSAKRLRLRSTISATVVMSSSDPRVMAGAGAVWEVRFLTSVFFRRRSSMCSGGKLRSILSNSSVAILLSRVVPSGHVGMYL